jgi:hypothetical protein
VREQPRLDATAARQPTDRSITLDTWSRDGGSRATICIGAAIVAMRHELDAGPMHQPVIAAVDPLRDDIAPVALGLMLAPADALAAASTTTMPRPDEHVLAD